MAKYIDADELRNEIETLNYPDGNDGYNYYSDIINIIDYAPTADVTPVVHAKWLFSGDDVKCTNCGRAFKNSYDEDNMDNYCRHCGAKMGGGE